MFLELLSFRVFLLLLCCLMDAWASSVLFPRLSSSASHHLPFRRQNATGNASATTAVTHCLGIYLFTLSLSFALSCPLHRACGALRLQHASYGHPPHLPRDTKGKYVRKAWLLPQHANQGSLPEMMVYSVLFFLFLLCRASTFLSGRLLQVCIVGFRAGVAEEVYVVVCIVRACISAAKCSDHVPPHVS
jgi:hypothetical protein